MNFPLFLYFFPIHILNLIICFKKEKEKKERIRNWKKFERDRQNQGGEQNKEQRTSQQISIF